LYLFLTLLSRYSGRKEKGLIGTLSLGLGLAICRLNAERMRGVVGYYEYLDEDSNCKENTFYLIVPLRSDPSRFAKPKLEDTQLVECESLSILAVDDEPMNLLILRKMLKEMGCHFDTAKSGKEGNCFLKQSNLLRKVPSEFSRSSFLQH